MAISIWVYYLPTFLESVGEATHQWCRYRIVQSRKLTAHRPLYFIIDTDHARSSEQQTRRDSSKASCKRIENQSSELRPVTKLQLLLNIEDNHKSKSSIQQNRQCRSEVYCRRTKNEPSELRPLLTSQTWSPIADIYCLWIWRAIWSMMLNQRILTLHWRVHK